MGKSRTRANSNVISIDDPQQSRLSADMVAAQEKTKELSLQLESMSSIPDEAAKKLSDLNLPYYISEDSILKALIESYKTHIHEFKSCFELCENQLSNQSSHEGYWLDLNKQLESSIAKLEKIRVNLLNLYDDMNARITIIFPQDLHSPEEFNQRLLDSQNQFLTTLELTLKNFSTLDLPENKSEDSQFFYNEILATVDRLKSILLATSLELNKTEIDTLHQHLASFLTAEPSNINKTVSLLKTLCSDLASVLLDETKTDNSEQKEKEPSLVQAYLEKVKVQLLKPERKEERVRRRIAAHYNAMSEIRALPFKTLCSYYAYEQEKSNRIKQFNSSNEKLLNAIEEWIDKLGDQTRLFFLSPKLDISEQKAIFDQLSAFKTDLLHLSLDEYIPLAADASAEERMDHLKAYIATVGKAQDTLDAIHSSFTDNLKNYENSLDVLKRLYSVEMIRLQKQMNKLLEQTQEAINALPSNEAQIELDLHKQYTVEKLTILEQKPLHESRDEVLKRATRLNLMVNEVKTSLGQKYAPALDQHQKDARLGYIHRSEETLIRTFGPRRALIEVSISNENPFKNDFLRSIKRSIEHTLKLKNHYESLSKIEPSSLSNWKNTFEEQDKRCRKLFDEKGELILKTLEIERRLEHEYYKVSNLILMRLSAEIARISQKYGHLELRSTDDQELVQLLQKMESSTHLSIDPEEHKDCLSGIDPRLIPLVLLRKDFLELQASYINKDIKLADDIKQQDKDYYKSLELLIINQLNRNDMEKYSDSKQRKLIQWLRINLLKPLLQLQQKASAIILRKETHNELFFFQTPWASMTERQVIKSLHEGLAEMKSLETGAGA